MDAIVEVSLNNVKCTAGMKSIGVVSGVKH
jgi:hypothetical protein